MSGPATGDLLWACPAFELPLPGGTHGVLSAKVPAFEVRRGGIILLTGTSGSGKSWLLSHLVGSSDASAIHWWPLHPRRRILSAVPTLPHHLPCAVAMQTPRIRGELPVDWEADFVQRSLGLQLDSALIDRVGIPRDVQVGRLSGGQAKRFGIALRLTATADIVALDEPEAGLDAASAALVIRAIAALPGSPAIIAVTHHVEAWLEALSEGDRSIQIIDPDSGSAESQAHFVMSDPSRAIKTIELTHSHHTVEAHATSSLELMVAQLAQTVTRVFNRLMATSFAQTVAGVLHWPLVARVAHAIALWIRSPLDWAVVFIAPLLIGLVIGLQVVGTSNQAQSAWDIKQSFFAVIAACWLGLQFMSRETHGQLLVQREEWRWLDRIRPLHLDGLPASILTIASGVIAASLIAVIQSFLLAAAVYVSASTIPGTPLRPDRWPMLWLGLGVASLWGVILGQALAVGVAAIQLANPFRRSLPSLLWVNLLIPLVMLLHIVFSSTYLHGVAYDPTIQCSGWMDTLMAAFPTNWCTMPASGVGAPIDELLFVIAASWATMAVSVMAMWSILRSPDIRRH